MKYEAYWIDPRGKIIPLEGRTKHIDDIIKNPRRYKLSMNQIKSLYSKYGEKLGQEGKARTELMTDLMKKGWIRVRYKLHLPGEGWILQPYKFDKKDKENIWWWAVKISDGTYDKRKYDDIYIVPIDKSPVTRMSLKEVLAGGMLEHKDPLKGITFLNIIQIKNTGDVEKLNEASLSRVYQHTIGEGSNSFGIITAYRAENTPSKNRSLMKKLEQDLRSNGLGFFKLKGHWVECQDEEVPYRDCPKNQRIDVVEPSFFVPNISRDFLLKLIKKYKQDGAIYSGPETKRRVELIFKNGETMNIGKFSPNKVAQAYSTVKGKNFVFEGFEFPAQTWIQNLMESAYKKK